MLRPNYNCPPRPKACWGSAKANLGEFAPPGDMRQISWQVWADGSVDDVLVYKVEVKAENSDANSAKESIQVVSPAQLKISFEVPETLQISDEQYYPAAFELKARVRNEGACRLMAIYLKFRTPLFGALEKKESQKRFVPIVDAGEEVTLSWTVRPTDGFRGGNLYYGLTMQSEKGQQPALNRSTYAPRFTAQDLGRSTAV